MEKPTNQDDKRRKLRLVNDDSGSQENLFSELFTNINGGENGRDEESNDEEGEEKVQKLPLVKNTRKGLRKVLNIGIIAGGVTFLGYAGIKVTKDYISAGSDNIGNFNYLNALGRTTCKYDYIDEKGLIATQKEKEFHLINSGKPLYPERYDKVFPFHTVTEAGAEESGFFYEGNNQYGIKYPIQIARVYNYNLEGGNANAEFPPQEWFYIRGGDGHKLKVEWAKLPSCEGAYEFHNGYAIVDNTRYETSCSGLFKEAEDCVSYHVKESCEPAYDERYDRVTNFHEGFSVATKDGKEFHIGTNGDPIYKEQFDKAFPFRNGIARVKLGEKEFHINQEGKPIYMSRFDEVGDYKGGYAKIRIGEKYTYINMRGEQITSIYFDHVDEFELDTAIVSSDEKKYLLKITGEIIGGYESLERGDDNTFAVRQGGLSFHVNNNGERIHQLNFKSTRPFRHGYAAVENNGKQYHIWPDGTPLYNHRFDKVSDFITPNFFLIEYNGKQVPIGINGRPIEGC